MKKTLFALSAFALVLLSGCSLSGKRDKKTFDEAYRIAANSINAKDTLFLGFNFGMDSITASSRFSDLLNEGKLFQKDGYTRYQFNMREATFNPAFGLAYEKDTLYKVSLAFFPENSFPLDLIKMMIVGNTLETFSNKGYDVYEKDDKIGGTDYYFIKNNTVISVISYPQFVIMSYTNAIVEKQMKQEEENRMKNLKEQTMSDI